MPFSAPALVTAVLTVRAGRKVPPGVEAAGWTGTGCAPRIFRLLKWEGMIMGGTLRGNTGDLLLSLVGRNG